MASSPHMTPQNNSYPFGLTTPQFYGNPQQHSCPSNSQNQNKYNQNSDDSIDIIIGNTDNNTINTSASNGLSTSYGKSSANLSTSNLNFGNLPPKNILREDFSISRNDTDDADDSDDSDSDDDDDDPNVPIGVPKQKGPSGLGGSSDRQLAQPEEIDDTDYVKGTVEMIDALIYMYFMDKSVKTMNDFKARYEEFSPARYSKLVTGSVGYLALPHRDVFEARWADAVRGRRVPFEMAIYKSALESIHKTKCEDIVTSILSELNTLLGEGVYASHRFIFSRELLEGAARALHGWLFDNVPGFAQKFSERLDELGIVSMEMVSIRSSSLWADGKLGVLSGLEVAYNPKGKPRAQCLKYYVVQTIDEKYKKDSWLMKLDDGSILMAYHSGETQNGLSEEVLIKCIVNNFVKNKYGMCLYTGFHTSNGEQNIPRFYSNLMGWQNAVKKHFNITDEKALVNLPEIKRWFSGFRPVHQCSKEAFCSILRLGALASLNRLATLWKNPEEIADCVFLSDAVNKLIFELSGTEGFSTNYPTIKMFVRARARKRQSEDSQKKIEELSQKVASGTSIKELEFGFSVFRCVKPMDPLEEKEYATLEKKLWDDMPFTAGNIIAATDNAINSLMDLLVGTKGLECEIDKIIGTDKVVFAIFGPNRGTYGNAEASIVFKDTVMRHPDTFLTPVAAMGFYQGWYTNNCKYLY